MEEAEESWLHVRLSQSPPGTCAQAGETERSGCQWSRTRQLLIKGLDGAPDVGVRGETAALIACGNPRRINASVLR